MRRPDARRRCCVAHWQPSVSVDAGRGAAPQLAYLSAHAARRGRGRGGGRRRFWPGVACVVVALQSGIDAYDDRLLSVHMVQHMLLLMLAPLLLLGGRPALLAAAPRSAAGAALRSPAAAADSRADASRGRASASSRSRRAGTHLPAFYDATLRHAALHELEHACTCSPGCSCGGRCSTAIRSPRQRLSGLGRLVYVIVAMLPMALVGAYLNRAPDARLPGLRPPARALGISARDDQQQAGAIMWVVGST